LRKRTNSRNQCIATGRCPSNIDPRGKIVGCNGNVAPFLCDPANMSLHKKIILGMLAFGAGLTAFAYIIAMNTSPLPVSPTQANIIKTSTAGECAKQWVLKNLKSPSSAKFTEPVLGIPTEWNGDASNINRPIAKNEFEVASSVDSMNSFGAMLSSGFYCKVDLIEQLDSFKCQSECSFTSS